MFKLLPLILASITFVFAQSTTADPPTQVSTDGFNAADNEYKHTEESWLKTNDRYVFIIVIVLLFLAILIWYIVRSIKSMRQKLAAENQGHMMMMQNASGGGFAETVPIDANGFHKMPDYPGPPPQQQQQQYTHRY